jgi:hypothetical protein
MVRMGRPVIVVTAVIAAVPSVLRHVRVLSAAMGCNRRINDWAAVVKYCERQ